MPAKRSPVPATPPRWDLDFEALARDLRPFGSATRVRLLNFLTVPRYLEEVASFLRVNRSAAKKHLAQLVACGAVAKVPGQRERGAVMEYRLVPEKLFELFDAMRTLGTLRPVFGDAGATPLTKPAEGPPERPLAEEQVPRLITVYGVDLGKVMPLTGAGARVIGREAECAVRILSDPFVSGRHAQVERAAAGFQVTDLFSRNGTFLDWQRLPAGQPRPVRSGQVLGVGRTLLLFRAD